MSVPDVCRQSRPPLVAKVVCWSRLPSSCHVMCMHMICLLLYSIYHIYIMWHGGGENFLTISFQSCVLGDQQTDGGRTLFWFGRPAGKLKFDFIFSASPSWAKVEPKFGCRQKTRIGGWRSGNDVTRRTYSRRQDTRICGLMSSNADTLMLSLQETLNLDCDLQHRRLDPVVHQGDDAPRWGPNA